MLPMPWHAADAQRPYANSTPSRHSGMAITRPMHISTTGDPSKYALATLATFQRLSGYGVSRYLIRAELCS